MLDKNGEMFTLIDGACREDNTMPILDPPFDLQIRGTVCYKKWRTVTPMEDFNIYPETEEAVSEEVSEEIQDIKEEGPMEEDDSTEAEST